MPRQKTTENVGVASDNAPKVTSLLYECGVCKLKINNKAFAEYHVELHDKPNDSKFFTGLMEDSKNLWKNIVEGKAKKIIFLKKTRLSVR
jgi:hypothetical protein